MNILGTFQLVPKEETKGITSPSGGQHLGLGEDLCLLRIPVISAWHEQGGNWPPPYGWPLLPH